MNQFSSLDTSTTANVAPDVISRRAYEIWEREGRPEGCDLRHWLQAEQELAQASSGGSSGNNAPVPPRHSDVAPLQGTRAAAAVNAARETKRPTVATSERNGHGAGQTAARKKPSSAPAL